MPYPNKRGGGGGGARSPAVVSGSPFADAAALEAWSVLNPHELLNNSTNYSTAMAGGASYEWRGDNGVYATGSWFRQNALTTVEQQNVDSITDLTVGTLPLRGAQGLDDSIATQDGMTQVMIDGELGTTKATVLVGQGLSLSEDGGTVRLDDEVENQSAIAVGTVLNPDGTTGVNYATRRHTLTATTVQPLQDETNVGNWTAHVPVTAPTRILKELRVRFAQPATGIRFTLRAASSFTQTDGIILFQSHTDSDWNNGAGYSVQESPLGAPVNFSVPIDRSAKVIENTLLYVVVEQNTQGIGDIELRGSTLTIGPVTGFFAYLEQDTVLEDRDLVPLAEDIPAAFRNTHRTTASLTINAVNVEDFQPFAAIEFENESGRVDLVIADDVFDVGDTLLIKHWSDGAVQGAEVRYEVTGGRIDGESDMVLGQDSSIIARKFASNQWRIVASHNADTLQMQEMIQDIVGGMVSGNTETNITVTYDDTNGKLDFNVAADTDTMPAPSLHNLTIDIPGRVDLNTNLNVQHVINFGVTNYAQLTALTLIVTTGANNVLTLPMADGVQSQNVTISGVSTAAQGTVTFQLSGTHAGGTVTSNIVTITVRNLEAQELTYVDFQADRLPASFTTAGANFAEFQEVQTLTIPTFSGSMYVVIAQPQAEADITSLLIGGLNQLGTFEKVTGTATIGGVVYEFYYSINTLIGSIVSGVPMTINRG